MEGPYTKVAPNLQHPQRELDENSMSTFGDSIHGSLAERHHESDYSEPNELVDVEGEDMFEGYHTVIFNRCFVIFV